MLIMQKEKLFDDIAKMAGGTVSLMSGLTGQIKDEIRARVDNTAAKMDLVPREDFDILQMRVDDLTARLEKLETPKSKSKSKAKPKPKPKKTKA